MIVVDSGIWISAMQFGGTPAAAIARCLESDEVATCDEIEAEVLDILERKFGNSPELARQRLAPLLRETLRVEVTGDITGNCRDPKDDCILECALKSSAQFIITGDKDLLAVGEFRGVRIITARQYLELAIGS